MVIFLSLWALCPLDLRLLTLDSICWIGPHSFQNVIMLNCDQHFPWHILSQRSGAQWIAYARAQGTTILSWDCAGKRPKRTGRENEDTKKKTQDGSSISRTAAIQPGISHVSFRILHSDVDRLVLWIVHLMHVYCIYTRSVICIGRASLSYTHMYSSKWCNDRNMYYYLNINYWSVTKNIPLLSIIQKCRFHVTHNFLVDKFQRALIRKKWNHYAPYASTS